MPEKQVPEMIFDKFAELLKNDPLFKSILKELISAAKQKHGKDKIKELLRKIDENNKPSN